MSKGQSGEFLPYRPPRLRPAPASLGNGFELADGFPAKGDRDEGADRRDHKYRAEEDQRRTGVRLHQERREAAGEQPPERLAEKITAPGAVSRTRIYPRRAAHGCHAGTSSH